jgi:thiamine biosynthesis protein ThiS
VEALKLDATQVAVERNRVIVPRSRWQEEPLQADDEVEIVRFIGGG